MIGGNAIIIGAGMADLTAASALPRHFETVTILGVGHAAVLSRIRGGRRNKPAPTLHPLK
jgi:predicted NAD/FAD-dependent oxidoreductase